MTSTETICACVTFCATEICGVFAYWVKKRKDVDVTKYVRVRVKSDKLEVKDEQTR